MRPKNFSLLVITISVMAFASVAVLNFVANPYAQYSTKFFPPIVQTSRSQKVALLCQAPRRPEALILGSSRVLKMEPSYLHQKTGFQFFNAGVNYGKPEDHLAFLRFYQQQFGHAPKMVVLGLDECCFSDLAPTDARLLSNVQLSSLVPEAIPFRDRFQSWKELLSWQQTVSSLKSIRHAWSDGPTDIDVEFFREDGMIVYEQREQQLIAGNYDFQSALDYNKREYKQLLAGYDRLSARRCQLFQTLVDTCRQNDTRLLVFLTPMHPDLQSYLEGSTTYRQRRDELISYLADRSAECGFSFCDLSEIGSFQGDQELFVDGVHPLEPNTQRMIDCLVKMPQPVWNYAVQ